VKLAAQIAQCQFQITFLEMALACWISVKPDDINVCSFSMLPKPE